MVSLEVKHDSPCEVSTLQCVAGVLKPKRHLPKDYRYCSIGLTTTERRAKAQTSVYDSNNPSSAVLSRATHYYKTDRQSARFVSHKLTELVDYRIMTLMVTVVSWLLVTRELLLLF